MYTFEETPERKENEKKWREITEDAQIIAFGGYALGLEEISAQRRKSYVTKTAHFPKKIVCKKRAGALEKDVSNAILRRFPEQ